MRQSIKWFVLPAEWFVLIIALAAMLQARVVAQEGVAEFSAEQLDQLTAPVALYPDTLLSQVLMAATYPADVAEAAQWSKQYADLQGDQAVQAVENEPWDPSVKSLAAFPQVLAMMGNKPEWVQNLGDAFLASSKDVLESVQRLRAKAEQAGNLKSNEQQKVVVQQEASPAQVIVIESTDPEVVYVPSYNPSVVYGAWPYPQYPPYYYPPPPAYYPGYALASGIAFGIGVAAVGSLWGDCDWNGGDVDIDVDRYNNINRNNQISSTQNRFQHNAANRRGVPYRDGRSRQQYERNIGGAADRANYRGRDPGREQQRRQAQSTLEQRGMNPSRGRDELRNDPKARERAERAVQDGSRNRTGDFGRDAQAERERARGRADSAFRDAGSADRTRRQIDRGNSSRQQMQRGGGRSGGGRGGGRR